MRFGFDTTLLAVTWLCSFGCATSSSDGSSTALTSDSSGDVPAAEPSGAEPASPTPPPPAMEPASEPEGASGMGGESAGSPSSPVEPGGMGGASPASGGAAGAPMVTPSANGGAAEGGGSAGMGNAGAGSAGAGSAGAGSAGAGNSAGASAAGSNASGSGGEGSASSDGGSGGGGVTAPPVPSILVFSATLEYRHESIPTAVAAFQTLADERGWSMRATEAVTDFADETLAEFNVVVFLHTSGELFDADQQAALQRFIQAGNGYVGVHSASTTEYDWPWYGELVGAYFSAHPDIQTATVNVENNAHPATANLPNPWVRTDEWYGFRTNPRDAVTVLLTLDENTYSPGDGAMGPDHPIAWYHEYDGGRSFYTALGHTFESYAEPEFLAHLAGAVEWAATP